MRSRRAVGRRGSGSSRIAPETAAARPEVLYGVHPILEAIETGRRDIDKIWVAREGGSPGLGRLLRQAREAGIPVQHVPREVLARKVGPRAAHQGIAAAVSGVAYASAEDVCRSAASSRGVIVVLDGIEDPHNLGAILRSAAAAGAAGVILGSEGTVGLTPAVAKASAGAVERIPVARDGSLGNRLAGIRAAGFRVVALDPRGSTPWDRADLAMPLAVVAGGEGRGLRPSVLRSAHDRVAIPLARGIESLNVSVAVAVLLFEALRRGRAAAPDGAGA